MREGNKMKIKITEEMAREVSCKMKSDTKKGQAEAPVVECFCKPNNTERGILHVQETFYHKYTKLQASNCFSKRSDTGTLEGGIA